MVRISRHKTGGETRTLDEGLELLSRFQVKPVSPVTSYRGLLEIGTLQIGIWAYIKYQSAKFPAFSKVSPEVDPETSESGGKVDTRRTYHRDDAEQTEINIQETIRAHRYGVDYFPWDDIAQDHYKSITVTGEKHLQVRQGRTRGSRNAPGSGAHRARVFSRSSASPK